MKLKIINAPGDQPITLQDAKDYLRVDGVAEDRLIRRLIANATNACQEFSNRTFIETGYGLTFDAAAAADYTLNVDHSPIIDHAVVATLAGQPLTLDACLDGYKLILKDVPKDAHVTITVNAGYTDDPDLLPAALAQAVMTLVAHWYENRDQADVPDNVRRILQPFKRYAL